MKNEDSQFVKIDIDVICDDMNNVKLSDGTIYVLNSDNGFVYEAQTAMKFWLMILERQHNGYIYDYKISVIHDTSAWLEHGILYEAIKDGVNIVLPISTPNTEKQQYIVAKANQETAGSCITNMIVKAEKLTKSAIEEALMNLAVQEPKTCKDVFRNVCGETLFDDDEPVKSNHCKMVGLPKEKSAISFKAAYSTVPANISYKESKVIINRFVENCNLINESRNMNKFPIDFEEKLQKAKAEVNYVFDLFSPKVYSEFMLQFFNTKNLALAFDNCINREKIAQNSKIIVSIETPDPKLEKDKPKLKTNGMYRIYLQRGRKKVQVQFGRCASIVVYIMYLLDRKGRGNRIDTLKIVNNEQQFCNIYGKIYKDYNGAESRKAFNTCKTMFIEGKVKEARLKDYYLDIRTSLDSSVAELGESALPFYIPNENSHITVSKKNIIIPETFKNITINC